LLISLGGSVSCHVAFRESDWLTLSPGLIDFSAFERVGCFDKYIFGNLGVSHAFRNMENVLLQYSLTRSYHIQASKEVVSFSNNQV